MLSSPRRPCHRTNRSVPAECACRAAAPGGRLVRCRRAERTCPVLYRGDDDAGTEGRGHPDRGRACGPTPPPRSTCWCGSPRRSPRPLRPPADQPGAGPRPLGSMAGAKKMDYAREAAAFAVEQLLPTDRVSVTTFDDQIETIVPNAPAPTRPAIVRPDPGDQPEGLDRPLRRLAGRGRQVAPHLLARGLNRVILLSDGLANEGVIDPTVIVGEVKALAAVGVSTTTMGLGDDYNEDLMQAMGEAGDGNYYYIESPVQLADIFQTELKGLMANVGHKVSLGIEPVGGVRIAAVLNDLSPNATGRLMLPNLVVGMPVQIVVRLESSRRRRPGRPWPTLPVPPRLGRPQGRRRARPVRGPRPGGLSDRGVGSVAGRSPGRGAGGDPGSGPPQKGGPSPPTTGATCRRPGGKVSGRRAMIGGMPCSPATTFDTRRFPSSRPTSTRGTGRSSASGRRGRRSSSTAARGREGRPRPRSPPKQRPFPGSRRSRNSRQPVSTRFVQVY